MTPSRAEEAERNRATTSSFFEALHDRRFDEALALLDDDGTHWVASGPPRPERPMQDMKAKLQLVIDGVLPTPTDFVVVNAIAEGDQVVADVVNEGTLPDGRPYDVVYGFVLRFRDGKIVSVREYSANYHGRRLLVEAVEPGSEAARLLGLGGQDRVVAGVTGERPALHHAEHTLASSDPALERNKRLAWSIFEAIREDRYDEALALMDDDGFHCGTGFGPPYKDFPLTGFKAKMRLAEEGVHQTPLSFVLVNAVAEGDQVAIELANDGTLPDGRPYEMVYLFVLEIRDGKWFRSREYADSQYAYSLRPEVFTTDTALRLALKEQGLDMPMFKLAHAADRR